MSNTGFKVIASLVGVAGVVGSSISVALWKTGTINTSSAENQSLNSPDLISNITNQEQVIQEAQEQLPIVAKKGNCEVLDSSKIDIFSNLGIERDNYLAIYCTEANSEDSEKKMVDNWIGLFPEEFFEGYYAFPVGTSFNLKMRTELVDEIDGDFKTSFSSNKFWDSPVEGIWGGREQTILGKSVTTVKVTSEEHKEDGNIYILFGQKI